MKRKLIFSLIMILALTMQAESKVSFLCVPVKGTKANFVKNLVSKGCQLTKDGKLKAVIANDTCTVVVNTNNETVTSVTAIEDRTLSDETEAVKRYNALLEYYKKSLEYIEYEVNALPDLQDSETVRRNIHEGGYYYAEFFQITERSMQDFSRRMSIAIVELPDGYHIVRKYDTSNDIVMLDKSIGTTVNNKK